MSYQLGAASRPRVSLVARSIAGRLVPASRVARRYKRRGRRSRAIMAMPPMVFATNYGRGLGESDDGLGFSLRPPRWVRKAARAVKRNVTLKRVLIGGALVGAAFIPGVAPAAMAVARGAGRGIVGAGRLVGKGARGAVHGIFGRKQNKAAKQPRDAGPNDSGDDPIDTDPMDRPSGSPPGAADRSPGSFGPLPGDSSPAAPGASPASGGGGGGPVPGDAADAATPPGAPSLSSLAVPVMIGLSVFALLSSGRRRRRGHARYV